MEHKHIVNLIGICADESPWIVMEYLEHGALSTYLQKNKFDIKLNTLLLFAYQLSEALQYLETKLFVHRNVQIKNLLVASSTIVKLSGFDLYTWSKQIEEKSLPIRWMSPESLKYDTFTTASDVWSFGKLHFTLRLLLILLEIKFYFQACAYGKF